VQTAESFCSQELYLQNSFFFHKLFNIVVESRACANPSALPDSPVEKNCAVPLRSRDELIGVGQPWLATIEAGSRDAEQKTAPRCSIRSFDRLLVGC
jgi:hypothetical protein